MEKTLTFRVRAGRDGDGYRAAILFPTRHGEIILSSSVPAGAARAYGQHLRELYSRHLARGEGSARDLVLAADAARVEGIESLLPALGAGVSMLPIPGAGMLGQALSGSGPLGGVVQQGVQALSGLLGGGGAPPPRFDPRPRPGNLPPVGSPANLERIARFVGVTDGMDAGAARAKLTEGAAQRWGEGDHADALTLLAALPRSGPVRVASLVASAAPSGAPAALPMPPAALPAAPATAASLASLGTGVLPAAVAAPALAVPAVLSQAARLASSAPDLFGPRAMDLAALAREMMAASDALVGGVSLGMPSASRRWSAMNADPRMAEAVNAARAFHSYLHGA